MLCKGEGSALDPHVPRKVEGALDVALVAVQVIAWSENRAWHTSGYFPTQVRPRMSMVFLCGFPILRCPMELVLQSTSLFGGSPHA
jgi:hypothetical protein